MNDMSNADAKAKARAIEAANARKTAKAERAAAKASKKVYINQRQTTEERLSKELRAAKALLKALKKRGLTNVAVERYCPWGVGIAVVWRMKSGRGYTVVEESFNKVVVSECRGPGRPASPEFVKRVAVFRSLEDCVESFR